MPQPQRRWVAVPTGDQEPSTPKPPDLDAAGYPVDDGPMQPSGVFEKMKGASPEIAGGISGILASILAPSSAGASLLVPPVVAGATTMIRDIHEPGGPQFKDVVGHMIANALPAAATKVPGAAKSAAGFMFPRASRWLGLVGDAAPAAAAAAAPAVSALERSTLPGGIKALSQEGLDYLSNLERQMSMQGRAFGDPQFDAIDEMITEVRRVLGTRGPDMGALAQRAGVAMTDPAARAAAVAKSKATSPSNWITNALRGVLGVGSYEAEP